MTVLETGKNSVKPSTTPNIAATSSECISLIQLNPLKVK
jgi:hypothetical protein